jgi:hypothetical protein
VLKRDDQQEGKIKASFALLGQTSKVKGLATPS